jgi:hypothetical protein
MHLYLFGGHTSSKGQLGNGDAQCRAPVINGFAECQGLSDGDPLWVAGVRRWQLAVVAGHHACLS